MGVGIVVNVGDNKSSTTSSGSSSSSSSQSSNVTGSYTGEYIDLNTGQGYSGRTENKNILPLPTPTTYHRHGSSGTSTSTSTTSTDSLGQGISINPKSRTSIQDVVPNKPYAVNINGNVYTDDNKVYPVTITPNTAEKREQYKNWIPEGYQRGTAIDMGNNSFIIAPEGSQGVSTKYGTAIKTGSQYTIVEPNEKAIQAEQKAYADWAATQKSYKPTTILDLAKDNPNIQTPTNRQRIANMVGDYYIKLGEIPRTIGQSTRKLTSTFENENYALGNTYIGGNKGSVIFPNRTKVGTAVSKLSSFSAEAPFWIIPSTALAFGGLYLVGQGIKVFGAMNQEERNAAIIGTALAAGSMFFAPTREGKGLTQNVIQRTARKADSVIVETFVGENGITLIRRASAGSLRKPTQSLAAEVAFRTTPINDISYTTNKYKMITPEETRYGFEFNKNPIKRLFFEPKQIQSVPRKPFEQSTSLVFSNNGVIVDNPVPNASSSNKYPLIFSHRKKSNVYTISTLNGEQQTVTPQDINKLLEPARSEIKRSYPITNEVNEYSIGQGTNTKAIKVNVKTGRVTVVPYGKRTTMFTTSSMQTPIYSNELGTYYATETKAYTKGKPRIIGDWESVAGEPKILTFEEAISKGANYGLDDNAIEKLKVLSTRSHGVQIGGKDIIVIQKRFNNPFSTTMKHEKGHFYDEKLRILDDMSDEERADLFQEAHEALTLKYKKGIPMSYAKDDNFLREGIAIRFEKRPPIRPLKEVIIKRNPTTINGQLLFLKEPIQISELEDDGVKILRKIDKSTGNINSGGNTINIQDTILNPSELKLVRENELKLASNVPKISPKFNKPKATSSEIIVEEAKKVIAPISKSIYYGQGTYERSEGGLIPNTKQILITQPREDLIGKERTKILIEPKIKIPILTRLREDNLLAHDNAIRHDEKIKEAMTYRVAEETKLGEKMQQKLLTKSALKESLANAIRNKLATKHASRLPPPKPLKKIQMLKEGSKVKQAFDVIIFNRGKEEKIATRLPENLAKKIGVQSVISNLRASFKLKPIGTTSQEDIEYKLPSSFRLGKYDKMRFVQKKETRFGSRPETKEAQFFRKVKKGKMKWF